MKRGDIFQSKYLSQDDLHGQDVVLVIKSAQIEEVGTEESPEQKLTLYFENATKGMVVNVGNFDTIEVLHGEDTDSWIGKAITVFVDPNVMFGRKKVGGIRVRPTAPAVPPRAAVTRQPVFTHQPTVSHPHPDRAPAVSAAPPIRSTGPALESGAPICTMIMDVVSTKVAMAGKQVNRYAIQLAADNRYYNTIDDRIGAMAQEAVAQALVVLVTVQAGPYGLELVALSIQEPPVDGGAAS